MEMRHEDFEYSDKRIGMPPPLDKHSIMVLANVLVASETSGHLRDPEVINYLFKSVFELVDFEENGMQQFSYEDVSTLVDAFYKS